MDSRNFKHAWICFSIAAFAAIVGCSEGDTTIIKYETNEIPDASEPECDGGGPIVLDPNQPAQTCGQTTDCDGGKCDP